MFQLLQPIWLFALAGLAAPIIIHLWNQRPGKTLRVGSIALVAENAVSQKKHIRLTELLLLIVRCLLLACIAMALAAPFLKQRTGNTSKGWVLMARQQLPETYQHFKPTIDSLLAAGMEFHYFEDDFAKEQLNKAIQALPDTSTSYQPSYRSIASALNEAAPAKLPLYIFTDNYRRHFAGEQTAVSLNLHWFTYTPGTLQQQSVEDTSAMRITIMGGTYGNDARYLKAALDAIQQFSKKNIVTKLATTLSETPASQDWLFWLSADTIPGEIKAANVLQYATGKAVPCRSFILPAENASFNAVDMYASVIDNSNSEKFTTVFWKDGFGRPLLATEEKDNTRFYWLYTHVDPAWNELPWSDNFPQLLYTLLYSDNKQSNTEDYADGTIIDSTQLVPAVAAAKEAGIKPTLFSITPLNSLFWLLSFVLFFAERLLSFYHRKSTTHG